MNVQRNYTAIYIAVILFTIIGASGSIGIFELPNAIVYDSFVRWLPWPERSAENILIVELAESDLQEKDKTWEMLIATLRKFGARQILFNFLPKNASTQFYYKTEAIEGVFFGRRWRNGNDINAGFLPLPEAVPGDIKNIFPSIFPPSHYGIYRSHPSTFNVNNVPEPTFIAKAAAYHTQTPQHQTGLFGVNFCGAQHHLPHIRARRILSEDLAIDLIRGRSIIIGPARSPDSPGFHTPLHREDAALSLTQYQGYALTTLIEHRAILWPSRLVTLLCILLVITAGLVIYPFLSNTLSLIYTMFFFTGIGIASWGMLNVLSAWPPVVDIVLAQCGVFLVAYLKKESEKNRIAKEMLLTRSTRIQSRFFTTGFYVSKEYWTRIINMVKQTLNLQRVIFLEKVENDHRVKEIIALNTSIDDIQERRRDYERTPYSTAIEANQPIPIKGYFKSEAETESPYLVPLTFSGSILGFWAFTVNSDQTPDPSQLLSITRRFSTEIAEILYKRKQWHREQDGKNRPLTRILRLEPKDELLQDVHSVMALLERRLTLLDLMVNSLNSAIILYDVFGQVTHVNQRMVDMLQSLRIAPFTLTALDLAIQLTDLSEETLRDSLRQMVVNHEGFSLPVTLGDSDRSYQLFITPLAGTEEDFVGQEAYPFRLHGMLFEMMDVTDVKNISSIKTTLFERISEQLTDGLESLTSACMLLEDSDLNTNHKDQIVTELNNKKQKVLHLISQTGTYMEQDVFTKSNPIFPVSTFKIIEDTMENLSALADKARITFSRSAVDIPDMVLAVPADLKKLFIALLTLLTETAYEESVIKVSAELYSPDPISSQAESHLRIQLENSGYGMPDSDLQNGLSSPRQSDSKAFSTLHQILPGLPLWPASLTGYGEVGKGLRFQVQLKRFL